ncbi:MAG: quinolinate synthase NadA [Clostridium sp.]|nr:quinolinate synthase NadA [Clostridium sp.]
MENLTQKIIDLKKGNDIYIMAHHYAPAETHEIADILGDSRDFFLGVLKGCKQKNILVLAPTFFGEITACYLKDKNVYVPGRGSTCPVAMDNMLQFEYVKRWRDKYPDLPLVVYGTSPLNTKLLADYLAFPGDVPEVINSVDADRLLYVGEYNCANEALHKVDKDVVVYPDQPTCNVYDSASLGDLREIKKKYPDAITMVHPECNEQITLKADYAVGTGKMIELIKSLEADTFILGVEKNFYLRMCKEFPEKKFIHLSSYISCSVFNVMRLERVYEACDFGNDSNTARLHVKTDAVTSERITQLINKMYRSFGLL